MPISAAAVVVENGGFLLRMNVVCGVQQLSAEKLELVSEGYHMPGMIHQPRHPSGAGECKTVVTVDICVVWNNTLYCGHRCVAFVRQYEQQLEMLKAAEERMPKLKPGDWTQVPKNVDRYCQRCKVKRTLDLNALSVAASRELPVYTNPRLTHAWGGQADIGVCALCARVVARHEELQNAIVCKILPKGQNRGEVAEPLLKIVALRQSQRRATALLKTASTSDRSVVVVAMDKLPDGLVLAPTELPQMQINRCGEIRSNRCYRLEWLGPLVFCGTDERRRVCAFCADENDAQHRDRIWTDVARNALLSIRTSTGGQLPVDIVDKVVGGYHLGRYFDELPIFVGGLKEEVNS